MIKKWLQDIFATKDVIQIREWRTDNSILKFLSSNLDEKGKLTKAANDLPDEKKDDDKIRFAPGLADAMFGPSESDDAQKRIISLSKNLKKIATNGDKVSEQEFYDLIAQSS